MSQLTRLVLTLDPGADSDARELEHLTRQLRAELDLLDLESVDLVRAGEMPQQAKAGDIISWGALIVDLATSGGLTSLINGVHSWLTRNSRCAVTMEIDGDRLELTGVASHERRQLIDLWLRRHSVSGGPDG
jgi:hypothetical protein